MILQNINEILTNNYLINNIGEKNTNSLYNNCFTENSKKIIKNNQRNIKKSYIYNGSLFEIEVQLSSDDLIIKIDKF